MKKLLITILYLFCISICAAAEKSSNSSLWASDEKGCKAYSRSTQPLDSIEWSGACKDGHIEGDGELRWFRDGMLEHVATGHFVKGLLQGRGIFESFSFNTYSSRFEGDFVDNMPNGQGIQTLSDGSRYEGTFKKGYRHGLGVMTWANGVRYEGEFDSNDILSERYKPVEIKAEIAPFYPKELRNKPGQVLLQLNIGEDHQIKQIDVIRSDHPLMERAALRSLQHASIKAAQLDGKPVPTIIRLPFSFRSSVATSFIYPATASKSFPEMFQYDMPPFDKVVAPLVYPFEFLKQQVRGSATVSFVIDPQGQPKQIALVESSEPAFGSSLRAMLASSSFFPARKNRQAVWSGFEIKKIYTQYGRSDSVINEHGLRILSELKKTQPNIFLIYQLDAAPKRFYTPAPVYPPDLADKNVAGSVQVEFYIDREGTVQFPHILKADHEELAWLALTAVSRWQFYPPTVKGEAVDARMTVPIVFNVQNQ